MKRLIIKNIWFSLIEKIFLIGSQFIASIIIIRNLPREDYGIIGVVTGYFVFIHILNVSLESIILRNHKEYDKEINKYMFNFLFFNIVKSLLFFSIAFLLSIYLINKFSNSNFIYAIFSITVLYSAESITAPFVIYYSAKFNQELVTKISIFKSCFNLLLLLGLFAFPNLKYIFFKDLVVSVVYISIWFYLSSNILDLKKISLIKELDLSFIKKSLFSYSIWTHFNGVVTNFIYKSDTFFLSLFVELNTIGNYNIALNSANVANIVPMILGYQNSIAISNTKTKKDAIKITNYFLLATGIIGILTFLIFYFFGYGYLELITGSKNKGEIQEIYTYMLYIVGGLVIVKSFASPLNAFINVKGSVFLLFKNVLLPIFIITCIVYYILTKYYGAIGIAKGNIIISILWLFLIINEVKKYDFKFLVNFRGI